jgi:eukaryotic-like serine/threonine-protein kinase
VEGVSWSAVRHGESPLPAGVEEPLEWHLDVLTQVAAAVEHAHRRGIIHRDLKPENVMIGELGEIYLLDWGLGVSLREQDRGLFPVVSDVGGVAGTPAYMAPEMLRERGEQLGAHTDVYLLGAVLHEILTGHPRHVGPTVISVLTSVALSTPYDYPPEVPAELGAICNRATARDPAERFASAEALRAAVVAFRRHRSSIRLSDEAALRLERMKELVAQPVDVEHQREVRDLFAAARFGFEQALAAWHENPSAQSGARSALETMVLFELGQRNLAAARSYLDLLDDPPARLARSEQALARELEAELAEYERLRRNALESDRSLGAPARAAAGMLFGSAAAGSLLAIQWADQTGLLPLSTEGYLGWLLVLVTGTAFGTYCMRNVVFSNLVNRQIAVGTVATLISVVALRVLVVLSGVSIHSGFRLELVVYGMGFAMFGVISNFRVLLASLLCVLGAVVDGALDRGDLYVVAGTVFLAFAALSWAWASAGRRSLPQTEPSADELPSRRGTEIDR